MIPWYKRKLDPRATVGGEIGVDGVVRKGGEFEPFYVPRPLMPQIASADHEHLIDFALKRGVVIRELSIPSYMLLHHQRVNWDPSKFNGQVSDDTILASNDHYILDGNHRAYGNLLEGRKSSIIMFGLEFEPAIDLLFQFPRVKSGEV